jgi:hypothetical protein
MEINQQVLQEKWAPVLDSKEAGSIADQHKRRVTAVVLENQEIALQEAAAVNNSSGSGVDNWDPVLISLVRRATPNLLAFDLVGVQPMTGPTGLIFAMKSRYSTAGGTEALFNEADTEFSGAAAGTANDSTDPFAGDTSDADAIDDYTPGHGNTLATAEAQVAAADIPQMAFSIDKTTVTAKSRALKAEYTTELAQDLKAVHGLSAETELANILSTEILAEMNREIIRTINVNSVTSTRGAAAGLNAAGVMDTGMGALGAQQMDSDVTGSLLAGTINGSMKVYVDPYAGVDYFTVGYKGANPYDAGMFFCPYVPLSMMKTIGENDFQPRIGFKTRYGMADNPFVTAGAGANVYYRKRKVLNL